MLATVLICSSFKLYSFKSNTQRSCNIVSRGLGGCIESTLSSSNILLFTLINICWLHGLIYISDSHAFCSQTFDFIIPENLVKGDFLVMTINLRHMNLSWGFTIWFRFRRWLSIRTSDDLLVLLKRYTTLRNAIMRIEIASSSSTFNGHLLILWSSLEVFECCLL